jgi:hypothetical protein
MQITITLITLACKIKTIIVIAAFFKKTIVFSLIFTIIASLSTIIFSARKMPLIPKGHLAEKTLIN